MLERPSRFFGFQFQVALGVSALVALAVGVTLLATTRVLTRRSMDLAQDDLAAARSAFSRLVASRAKTATAQVRLITRLPVFRAHMTSQDLRRDAATLEAMVDDYRHQLGARFALLTGRQGTPTVQPGWYADDALPPAVRADVKAAFDRQSPSSLVAVRDTLYLIVTEPVTFGDEVLGTLSVGLALDDTVAHELAEITHSEISLIVGDRVSGSSLDADAREHLLASVSTPEHNHSGGASLVTLGPDGRTFVSGVFPLTDAAWSHQSGELILLRDWRPTQVFVDQVRQQILHGGLVVLIAALVLGVAFSSHVTRPFRDVSAAASRLAAGDWSEVPVRGGSEAATMAAAFNTMGARLRDTYRHLQERTQTLEHEVQERQRAENKLLVAKSAAEQASVAKSAFLANMSHELRTPLNAIIGYSELLQEQVVEQGHTDYLPDLDRIVSAGQHLLALISGVLDLSRIEAGRMELDVDDVDVGALVQDALATVYPMARERGNRVTSEGIDDLGLIQSDETKLRQVLLNVVGNACKFTSDGTIHVTGRRTTTYPHTIIISVTDSGIGMTREQTSRLFRDYAQADGSLARRYGGTGLGLAISQRLCRLMGGTISVKSLPGRGSTFTITIPAAIEPTASGDGADAPSLSLAS